MARRLDGSTGGESLAGPRLRAFLFYLSAPFGRGSRRRLPQNCGRLPARILAIWRGKIEIVRFLRAFLRILTVSCALFRRFCRVKNGGGGARLIFMAEGEGKSARMGKGGKYGISY